MTTSISGNMIRIAQKHGWNLEDRTPERVTLVRGDRESAVRMWVDFTEDGTVRRVRVAKVGGPEQHLEPIMGAVHAFLKKYGSGS